jgi:hypothetical protein
MKRGIYFFTLIMFYSSLSIGAGWNSATTTESSSSTYTKMHNFANKDGIHTVRIENGSPNTLAYKLINTSGSEVRSSTIDNGVSNSPVITGDNSDIFAVYVKSTSIYVKKSSDAGANWSNSSSFNFESGQTGCYGIDAKIDGEYIHIVYSTYANGVNPEVYYKRFKTSENSFDQFKNVTDYGSETGRDPSITASTNRVHVSYTQYGFDHPDGKTMNRDKYKEENSWYDPQQINSDSPSGISSIISDNSYVYVVYVASHATGGSTLLTSPLKYTKRSVDGSSWDSPTELSGDVSYSFPPRIVKTSDGYLHVVYTDWQDVKYRKYNGSNWDDGISLSSGSLYEYNVCIYAVSNDLYVNWLEYASGYNNLMYRQMDNNPSTPQNIAVSAVADGDESHPRVTWTCTVSRMCIIMQAHIRSGVERILWVVRGDHIHKLPPLAVPHQAIQTTPSAVPAAEEIR